MRIAVKVVDGMYGHAADGIRVRLERVGDNGWTTVASARTDSAGGINDWTGRFLECGLYRIIFDTDSYFAGLGASTAYPEVLVVFRMQSESDTYQIQLTVSPYSYSTHFGAERQLHLRNLEGSQAVVAFSREEHGLDTAAHMDRPLLPAHLRPVLEQLLAGTTDDVASRRLNMSTRTFSRRVAELLECLQARSRFQAGVEAVHRGLLHQTVPTQAAGPHPSQAASQGRQLLAGRPAAAARKPVSAELTASGRSRNPRCPAPVISTYRQPGIASATSRQQVGGVTTSASKAITRHGQPIRDSESECRAFITASYWAAGP